MHFVRGIIYNLQIMKNTVYPVNFKPSKVVSAFVIGMYFTQQKECYQYYNRHL